MSVICIASIGIPDGYIPGIDDKELSIVVFNTHDKPFFALSRIAAPSTFPSIVIAIDLLFRPTQTLLDLPDIAY
jgi:hypothetical protein